MLLLLRAFSLVMNIYIYMLPCVLDGVSIDRFDEHELFNLTIVISHFNLNQQIKTRRIHMPFFFITIIKQHFVLLCFSQVSI